MKIIKTSMIFNICLTWLLFSACSNHEYLTISSEEIQIKPHLKQLITEKKECFKAPYTFIVMLDQQSCPGNLVESVWWKDWQKFMLEKNMGFIFVTSKQDSSDVDIATRLDSVVAPILTISNDDKLISNLWKPGQSSPLKLLIDSSGNIEYYWLSILKKSQSECLIHKIETLIEQN